MPVKIRYENNYEGNKNSMDCKEMILSDNIYDYITDFPIDAIENYSPSFCYTDIEGLYNILHINRSIIPNLDVAFFAYQNIPKLYGLMQEGNFDPTSLIVSGITQVQRPPLNLRGRGVVICLIDTGIDYSNPVFLDENGNSRILAIWDQTIQTGTPPNGFLYGSEYTREAINRALRSRTPFEIVPSRDANGHGTAMAAVAAGNSINSEAPYRGAAPEAELVIVKLKECKPYLREFYLLPEDVPAYQENDIMQGIKYADSFAELFERPVVICLGLGTNQGDHTGSSALSAYLNYVALKRSRGVVVCGGNEGNAAHHYRGMLSRRNGVLEDGEDVEVRVEEGAKGFLLEVWGKLPDTFRLEVRSPGGETVPLGRLVMGQAVTYGFVYEKSRITIQAILVEPTSGSQLILIRLETPTSGIWTFRVSGQGEVHNGEFHMWLPITAFLNTEVYFLRPDPYTTLTEPAMAEEVISVSTYDAGNLSFHADSGRGFSADGSIRPDIAAPGVKVATPGGSRTGSSLAAAICAGGVAQLLQWAVVEGNNRFAESREIKSYLIRGAARDANITYPNREWGYGRLDVEGIFRTISEF